MERWESSSDEDLILAARRAPDAFATFYRRYEEPLLRFFLRRTRDPELALDLTAETFAAALHSSPRFKPRPEPARAWLFGVARNTLAMSLRRGRVEQHARRKLGMPVLEIDDALAERLSALAAAELLGAHLEGLPVDQRDALVARIVDEREYSDIAADLKCSQAVVRKRVSRGLPALRAEINVSSWPTFHNSNSTCSPLPIDGRGAHGSFPADGVRPHSLSSVPRCSSVVPGRPPDSLRSDGRSRHQSRGKQTVSSIPRRERSWPPGRHHSPAAGR
jgi:RNA polymerase sigma factor (sigma-70 family)